MVERRKKFARNASDHYAKPYDEENAEDENMSLF
jgi:hypothetical protein